MLKPQALQISTTAPNRSARLKLGPAARAVQIDGKRTARSLSEKAKVVSWVRLIVPRLGPWFSPPTLSTATFPENAA
jgi:hypothetical protein